MPANHDQKADIAVLTGKAIVVISTDNFVDHDLITLLSVPTQLRNLLRSRIDF